MYMNTYFILKIILYTMYILTDIYLYAYVYKKNELRIEYTHKVSKHITTL